MCLLLDKRFSVLYKDGSSEMKVLVDEISDKMEIVREQNDDAVEIVQELMENNRNFSSLLENNPEYSGKANTMFAETVVTELDQYLHHPAVEQTCDSLDW
eukprot:snap_masked-scaffold_30-processed-gene-2.54-mRNA-1 protein AED:1.00 eAED:1.00 QI:0/-1/0/0/-1/1/1/0/99